MNDRMIEKINNWGILVGILGVVIAFIGLPIIFLRESAGLIIFSVGAFLLLVVSPALWGMPTSRQINEFQKRHYG